MTDTEAESGGRFSGVTERVKSVRGRVRSTSAGRLGWRIGVTVVGLAIIAGGIVLLPLPGPGWLIIFAGLGLLATEYDWAKRLLRYAKEQVSRWTAWLGRQNKAVQSSVGVVAFLLLAGLIALAWWWYQR